MSFLVAGFRMNNSDMHKLRFFDNIRGRIKRERMGQNVRLGQYPSLISSPLFKWAARGTRTKTQLQKSCRVYEKENQEEFSPTPESLETDIEGNSNKNKIGAQDDDFEYEDEEKAIQKDRLRFNLLLLLAMSWVHILPFSIDPITLKTRSNASRGRPGKLLWYFIFTYFVLRFIQYQWYLLLLVLNTRQEYHATGQVSNIQSLCTLPWCWPSSPVPSF